MAVLRSMKRFVTKALLAGQVVVLQGKCYPEEALADEEFEPRSMIKGHKIVFRPEAKLKEAIAMGLSLKRISSEAME